MANLNTIILAGRLSSDPETGYSGSGDMWVRFSVAVNGFKKEEVDYFSCVAFKASAKFVSEYLSKGDNVVLQGSMKSSKYEKDGQKRTSWSVVVNNVSATKSSSGGSSVAGSSSKNNQYGYPSDDPFADE